MNDKSNSWESLSPGDFIDIIAPASATSEDKLDEGLSWIKAAGFRPRFPADMIATDLFFAAPLQKQWEHLQAALHSDSKVIWCLRGGYGSMRLIPLLETMKPPPTPKLLIGFSDVTSLHLYFNQKWNWPSLHGRTISQLKANWKNHEEETLYGKLLMGESEQVVFNNLIPLNDSALGPGSVNSTVTGGNLRIVQSSLGTKWQIQTEQKILFLEDVSERGYSVDRMLEQLYQAGILNQGLKALIFGDFSNGLEKDGKNLIPDALLRFAQRVNYPVLSGLPCGHGEFNYPLPFNTSTILTTGAGPTLSCSFK